MSIREITLTIGRSVQIVDYSDQIRYDVTVKHTRDVEGGEGQAPFIARAKQDTADIFKDVEAAMLDTAQIAAREECEQNPQFNGVNEYEKLDPKFSPAGGGGKKAPRRRRPPPK